MLDLSDDFIRGVLTGLSLSLMTQRMHSEPMGSPSHSDIVDMYDSGLAYLTEKAVR